MVANQPSCLSMMSFIRQHVNAKGHNIIFHWFEVPIKLAVIINYDLLISSRLLQFKNSCQQYGNLQILVLSLTSKICCATIKFNKLGIKVKSSMSIKPTYFSGHVTNAFKSRMSLWNQRRLYLCRALLVGCAVY